MGWEFAALWVDEPDRPWQWVWRRVADDSGLLIEQSGAFLGLDSCIRDAKEHGFDEGGCGVESSSPQ